MEVYVLYQGDFIKNEDYFWEKLGVTVAKVGADIFIVGDMNEGVGKERSKREVIITAKM